MFPTAIGATFTALFFVSGPVKQTLFCPWRWAYPSLLGWTIYILMSDWALDWRRQTQWNNESKLVSRKLFV
jgi:hypothetical protein